ncbi:MAG: Ig-like domain-containing protein [Bacilli bacterium]|nr:Ig-like domain-containing protein [Bacilli bacterium]
MKRSRLFFTNIIALGLVITACNFSDKVIQSVDVTVEDIVRKTGDFFSKDDINVYFTYKSGKELIEHSDSVFNQLDFVLKCPESGNVRITSDNYFLSDIGTYELEVTYNPDSKYLFPVSGSTSFDVLDRVVPATSLTLGSDSISLYVESSEKVDYLLQPLDATSAVYFESSDPSIADVSPEGVVTGISEGQCIITTFVEDIKKECLVTVSPSEKIDYVFHSNKFEAQKGNWDFTIPGNQKFKNGVNVISETTITSPIEFKNITKIKYKVANNLENNLDYCNAIISTYIGEELIDECVIESLKEEYTCNYDIKNKSGFVSLKIKPTSSNQLNVSLESISIVYNGEEVYPTSISLQEGMNIPINANEKMTISFSPKQANQRFIEWESSDEEILTVGRDGTILGKKEGNAIVTAKVKTEDGYTSSSVSVRVYKVVVRSIELENDQIDLFEGFTKQIKYTVLPVEASFKDVLFRSSNENVATVDSFGNITGKKPGECIVLVRSKDELTITASCRVVVSEKPPLSSRTMSYNLNDFSSNTFFNKDSAPSLDKVKFLVIPVWFKDSSVYITSKENVQQDLQKAFFGTQSETGWQSVKSFYEKESNDRLLLRGVVSDWYEVNYNHNVFDYNLNSGAKDNSRSIEGLVNDATDWYFNNHSDNRKNYDCDGDGYLDGVALIYGCPDYSSLIKKNKFGQYGDSLWAFTSWLRNKNTNDVNKPGPNAFLWASYDFMYSEEKAYERTKKSTYGCGNTDNCNIDSHTYIHEIGHIFGLEDYYDYSNKYNPAGGFSMQDANVGGHDPFSCLVLGWADAYVPYEDCEITLTPFQDSHQVIILSPSFNSSNSPFDEYLLLELYTPTGLNEFDVKNHYKEKSPYGVNQTGIRIWHVDARLVEVKNTFNTAYSEKSYVAPFKNNALMMSNTYYSPSVYGYMSPCGEDYSDFNLLQLIRNSSKETYRSKNAFSKADLFMDGSSFNMETYKKQFVFNGKLNSAITLDWEFSINIKGTNEDAIAIISLNKIN